MFHEQNDIPVTQYKNMFKESQPFVSIRKTK